MTTEPKIFTHADLEWLERETDPRDIIRILRERGLIAEEPVDALHLEAIELAAQSFELQGDEVTAREIRAGVYNHEVNDRTTLPGLALAALRRGMELQREKLTREMVGRAVDRATYDCNYSRWDDNFAQFLHTAIQEALP